MDAINGSETEHAQPDPLAIAQQQLVQVAMGLGLSAEGAALSAYINGILQSARVMAIVKYLETDPQASLTIKQLTIGALLNEIIPKLEAQKAKAPSIVLPHGRH